MNIQSTLGRRDSIRKAALRKGPRLRLHASAAPKAWLHESLLDTGHLLGDQELYGVR
jgi:hypothetical protein